MARLDDPGEFEIIKKIYFIGREPKEELDPIERLERIQSRQRNKNIQKR